ncbi:MAG: C1 family peptidase [Thermoplasmatota archaeon]
MKSLVLALAVALLLCFPLLNTANITYPLPETVGSNTVAPPPPSFTWQNVNGTDYTTPVKNQEPCPSCEAYALCAVLETLVHYEVGYNFGCDLSEAHLFFCPGGTCAWGVNVSHAADYLVEFGVPDEGCFPDPHRRTDSPCNQSLPGWENRTVKIRDWGWVENDIAGIKQALIEHGPLVICIWVWKDFMYYSGGVYRHRWGALEGGHLVTLMGYDDGQQCWIVKNSWGSNWGEEGWFRMAYDADMFIPGCYGGTGILYVDGVYGTFRPDAPRVYIEQPRRYHSYLWGTEFPSVLGRALLQIGIPRLFGPLPLSVNATNTAQVEFVLDGDIRHTDGEPPFTWLLRAAPGLHTLEVLAYTTEGFASKDIVDFYTII